MQRYWEQKGGTVFRSTVGAEWHGGPGYVTLVCDGVMVLEDVQTTPNI